MPDAFDLLRLEPTFDLDPAVLEAAYLREAAAAHPDRFDDPLEQADALDHAAAVTDARLRLADPESRARVLLERSDATYEAGSPPPELLMDVMELREELEAARHEQDAVTVTRLREQAAARRGRHLARLSELFGATDPDAAAVTAELNALRYMQRTLDQTAD